MDDKAENQSDLVTVLIAFDLPGRIGHHPVEQIANCTAADAPPSLPLTATGLDRRPSEACGRESKPQCRERMIWTCRYCKFCLISGVERSHLMSNR
jgi:hypothetical protein